MKSKIKYLILLLLFLNCSNNINDLKIDLDILIEKRVLLSIIFEETYNDGDGLQNIVVVNIDNPEKYAIIRDKDRRTKFPKFSESIMI